MTGCSTHVRILALPPGCARPGRSNVNKQTRAFASLSALIMPILLRPRTGALLAHELRKAGLKVEYEKPITVHYDGLAVGNFSADMLVDDKVMLELKANQ